jgi:polysaccharide export outer membrane protein
MRLLYCFALVAVALICRPAFSAEVYILQPEDVLTVSVYNHTELSRDVIILNDGGFDYPIVGKVSAAGKTTSQVADIIAKGLKSELLDPAVTVIVRQPAMRRVYISGLVSKPGAYDLKAGWRVSNLIAEAGGLGSGVSAAATMMAYRPENVKGVLVRGDENIDVNLEAALTRADREADVLLKPGDLLQVLADTNLIHVVGQVRSPGDYQIKSKLGAAEAISAAGGATDRAALTRAQVIRGSEVIPVNLYALLVEGKMDANVALQAGDTLLIPANESRIAVLGGVQAPGFFDLPDGKTITVADAIGLAKGAKERSGTKSVSLIREVDGRQIVSSLDFAKYTKKGDVSQNPSVRAGDVIYVPEPGTVNRENLAASTSATLASGILIRLLFP